jgi:MFS family permease
MKGSIPAMRHRFTGLWQHPDFLKLWTGQAISMLGSEITPIALPLIAAIIIGATPSQMALLRAMQYAPAMLVGLFAGVLVDRMRRRPIMIGASLGQGLLLISLPIAVAFGVLRMELLLVVAFSMGVLGVLFGIADSSFLPTLLRRDQLAEGNSKLASSSSIARVVGPGLGGVLVQVLTAPVAIAIDGISFLVSALAVALIRTPEPKPPRPQQQTRISAEIIEGLRELNSSPFLRAFAVSSATLDIFWNALMAVYFLFVTRELQLLPSQIGLIFGIGSLGAFLGSLLARNITQRFGLGLTIIGAQFVLGLGGLLIIGGVLLPSIALPMLIAAEVVQSFAAVLYDINRNTLTQAVTPDRLLGRINASNTFIVLSITTIGALLGGVLGESIGLSTTIIVSACGGMLAFLWLLFSPIRSLRQLPEPVEAHADQSTAM